MWIQFASGQGLAAQQLYGYFLLIKIFLMIVHFLYFCDNADQLFASGILPDSTY